MYYASLMASSGSITMVPYKVARHIQRAERDVALNLDSPDWPDTNAIPAGWTLSDGRWCREVGDTPEEQADGSIQMAGPIQETLLCFPSAPLHGWQRLHEYHVNLDKSENLHTYRVLSHPKHHRRFERIFLMHNGLNETQTMGFYYQLASRLIYENRATACVLRPFPGHLTRFPFEAFAETPLDRYLWDGSHLFRQFLRYMIETQWFLSAIVRRSSYRNPAGANLLAEHADPAKSRLKANVLAPEMAAAWNLLYDESAHAVQDAHSVQSEAPRLNLRLESPKKNKGPFFDAVNGLRRALRLNRYPRLDGELKVGDKEPSLHVIGYSLGGFTAQSVFMSWPFLIASCTTLLSGGALRELAPTAFTHPEEWQTVLHSLRYELDDAMMSSRYGGSHEHVAGIEQELFRYLKRTFYEVFQQEYRGSFQSRLAAFRQRMLFVVGGNDPIVRPRTVLDSAPPGGINMLAIGGLGHFLEAKAQNDEEKEQRSFWLPELGRLVGRFADGATAKQDEERPYTWLDAKQQFLACPPKKNRSEDDTKDAGQRVKHLSAPERLAISQDGALPGELFERCLDDLLARQTDGSTEAGLLFILRNELPTVLLDEQGIYEHAAMLNHDDMGIARYAQGVRSRQDALLEHRQRIALILPWNAKRIVLNMDSHPGYPSQAESAKGQMPDESRRADVWKAGLGTCMKLTAGAGKDSVRVFDGRSAFRADGAHDKNAANILAAVREVKGFEDLEAVSSLPDCWVWMSREFIGLGKGQLTITQSLKRLAEMVSFNCTSLEMLDDHLCEDDLRIVTVSRARYNPRFRGRIIVDPKVARDLLLHVALCVGGSVTFGESDLAKPEGRDAAWMA